MSFILDALKKSESERQRQAGPGLMEVRLAQPRTRLPLWALLLGGLLLANTLILGAVLLLRDRGTPVAPAAPAATAAVDGTAPDATPPAAPAHETAPPPQVPLAGPATVPQPAPVQPDSLASRNPADYAPALPAGSLAGPATAALGEENDLPTRDDLVAARQPVPEIRLSLHVYDPTPANRYVLLNSTRLREGESMGNGLRLERITEGGVVLSWQGNRFRLRQGD